MADSTKQYSEMTEEERASYKEPGAQEGDWMDYLMPLKGLLGAKLMKQAAKQSAKKAASKALNYEAMKVAENAKKAQGDAQAATWKKPEGSRKWPELEMPKTAETAPPAAAPAPDSKYARWLKSFDDLGGE